MCVHVSHPWLGRLYSHHPTGVCLSFIFTLCRRWTREQAYNCGKHRNAIFAPGVLCLLNGQLLSSVSHSPFPLYFVWSFITPGYQMAKSSSAQNCETKMCFFDIKKTLFKMSASWQICRIYQSKTMLSLLSLLFNNGLVSSSDSHFMDHISRKLCCCLNMLLFVTLSGVAPYWVFFSTPLEEMNMFKDRHSCLWLHSFLEILKAKQFPCFCLVPYTFPSRMGKFSNFSQIFAFLGHTTAFRVLCQAIPLISSWWRKCERRI